MKKKKLTSILVTLAILLSTTTSLAEHKIGDIIGTVYNTDIVAYINNYAISSYAANGTSVVVAEDLRHFGFNVIWNQDTRTLNISRDINANPKEIAVMKTATPNTKFTDLLYTDIKVYADGIMVPSYAINGYTMIPLESLTMFGKYDWSNEERALKLWIDNMPTREEKQHVDNLVEPSSVVYAFFNHFMNYDFKYAISYTSKWNEDFPNLDEMISTIVDSTIADGVLSRNQAERFIKAIFAKMISVNSYEIKSIEKSDNGYIYNVGIFTVSEDFLNNSIETATVEATEYLIATGKITDYTSEATAIRLIIDEAIKIINALYVPTTYESLEIHVTKIDGNWLIVNEDDLI